MAKNIAAKFRFDIFDPIECCLVSIVSRSDFLSLRKGARPFISQYNLTHAD